MAEMTIAAERTIVSPTVTRAPGTSRLAWIDWMRGLACIFMFQTHCYDSWLGGEARNTEWLKNSQRLGTLPAPLFLFVAGISFALVTGKLIRKGATPSAVTRGMLARGAEIVGFGLLFRLQEYVIAWGWAPWSDLFRVDVLNIIGLSMILMALVCGLVLWIANGRNELAAGNASAPNVMPAKPTVIAASSVVVLIALLTPLVYTSWRPTWLPWQLESYIDGCHNLGAPQPWLFCIFPWTGFAFAGLAAGVIIFSDWARERLAQVLGWFAAAGAAAIAVAYALDHSSFQLYSTYDYWHTSPNFFMMRVGMLLVIVFVAYVWCRWVLVGMGSWATRFSPLIQLGQTSLLVYWVHIEFVYGRFSLLPKRGVGIAAATRGLIEIFLFMLILSILRTRIHWKGLRLTLRERISQPVA
jgi:surface polysaccharide O-acyltransferase-like enzyme